jgi:site-specific DNA-cytosine methylase
MCSGIGGLDLGVSLAGGSLGFKAATVCYLERGIEACEVLATRIAEGSMAEAVIYAELESFDGRAWRGKVDLITAGLPCQPFSVAGKQQGEADDRYIWPEFFRILGEVRPALVFLENVPAFLAWFQPIGEELSEMGYQFEAGLYSAEECGSPQKRERFFCLAHDTSNPWWAWGARHITSTGGSAVAYDASSGARGEIPIRQGWQGRDGLDLVGPDVADAGHPERPGRYESKEDPHQAQSEQSDVFSPSQSGDVAHSECPEWWENDGTRGHSSQRINRQGKAPGRPGECSQDVAHTDSSGRQQISRGSSGDEAEDERRSSEDHHELTGDEQALQRGESDGSRGYFPPGPAGDWSAVSPELKPAFCRVADGASAWLDRAQSERPTRLHALGNTVVPLTAALAFICLWRKLNRG